MSITRAEAIAATGRILAVARPERDELHIHGGAEAVAEAAVRNGTPQQRENVARLYESLRAQAMSGGNAA